MNTCFYKFNTYKVREDTVYYIYWALGFIIKKCNNNLMCKYKIKMKNPQKKKAGNSNNDIPML